MLKTYLVLMDELKGYVNPAAKIARMVKAGEIVRIKQGLYETDPQAYRLNTHYRTTDLFQRLFINIHQQPLKRNEPSSLKLHSECSVIEMCHRRHFLWEFN